MAVKQISLILTDTALHARHFRPAKTLDGAVAERMSDGTESGRLYMNGGIKVNPDGTFSFEIKLPEELQKQIDAGEVELKISLPEGGLPIFLSRDGMEKLAQIRKKERLRLARTGKVWRNR